MIFLLVLFGNYEGIFDEARYDLCLGVVPLSRSCAFWCRLILSSGQIFSRCIYIKHWVLPVLRCFLLPCSAPIHMLPTRTLDQAQHCPKAAWDTPLPPNSHPSTPTRPTATEKNHRHHAHAQTHPRILTRTHIHSPQQPHLDECTEGCWDICRINNNSLSV